MDIRITLLIVSVLLSAAIVLLSLSIMHITKRLNNLEDRL